MKLLAALFCFFLVAVNSIAQINKNKLDSIVIHSSLPIDQKENRIKIIVGQVNGKSSSNSGLNIEYTSYGEDQYFYPASTVKLPVVLLTLEWLNEHKSYGINLNSTFELISTYSCHNFINFSDKNDDKITIENCLKKILLVSDNNSYNILFDLLGRDYISKKLKEKGYNKSRIVKSFSGCIDSLLNTKPELNFYNNGNLIYHEDSLIYQSVIEKLPFNAIIGDSIMLDSSSTIPGGKDFSLNNYLPLDEALQMLVGLINPDSNKMWNLTSKQRHLVMYWMSRYPKESNLIQYSNTKQYFDAYKKYLIYGRDSNIKIKSPFRIYNIVGLSYGFATDIAYIRSNDGKQEMYLAATIYSNRDKVMNDNKYDYELVCYPFLKYIGKELYNSIKK